jgi:ferredoxin
MLFIDPDSCTECSACAYECPTSAIFHESDVPEALRDFIELNAQMSKSLPSITQRKTPLAGRSIV